MASVGAPVRKWSPALPLLADGRLPEGYLAQAPLYRGTVLAMLSEIEVEGSLAEMAAERIAWRRAGSLAQTFRHQDTIPLLSDLALALARLRARLSADLPLQAAEAWLDQQVHGWRDLLPLRFSVGALEALIRPALQAASQVALQQSGPRALGRAGPLSELTAPASVIDIRSQ